MKKIKIILLLLLGMVQCAMAQINWGDYVHSYQEKTFEDNNSTGIITAIKTVNESFWDDTDDNALFAPFAKDTAFLKARPKDFLIRSTYDTSKVHIFLHGVNDRNAGDYVFSIHEYTGKVLVPFTRISHFTDQTLIEKSGIPKMAYLGGILPEIGKTIIVDIKRKGSQKILETIAIKRKALKPLVQNIYTSADLNTFLSILSRPYEVTSHEGQKEKYAIKLDDLGTGFISPRFLPSFNSLIFLMRGKVTKKEQLEYKLIRNDDVIVPWKINNFDGNFIWLNNLKAGKYTLSTRYPIQPANVSILKFEVLPAWYETTIFKIMAGILVSGFGGAFIFLMLYIGQKQKTAQEQMNKTKVQLELKAIYAQLNPHFIFNAISSIQGLINKQDIKSANLYLSDFAKLMRESLIKNNKEVLSLEEEKNVIDTYLKLEQLRFGFQYQITVDDKINPYETDIPTLLLQPLVENAVKHGISHLQNQGKITLHFAKAAIDMIVTISDNGKGFEPSTFESGFGLKLTRDRITLLNKLGNDQHIHFQIRNQPAPGTTIELKFSNWFL